MLLDSVMVRASSPAEVRHLRRAGGEVWQEYFQGMATGGTRWRYSLVKVPAAAAIRLRLVTPGAELGEVGEIAEAIPAPIAATVPATPAAKRRNAQRVTQRRGVS